MVQKIPDVLTGKYQYIDVIRITVGKKGASKNTIGRIRRYFPKGTDLSGYTDHDIQLLEDMMNNTPRKCLNYLTPKESLLQFLNYNLSYKPKWCSSK